MIPDVIFMGFATAVLLTMLLGFLRIEMGPTPTDRMLAAQLFGTSGVAVLLLLAEAHSLPALRDAALVLALLAAITGIAFVKRAYQIDSKTAEEVQAK
ncbi:MAG: pH regulation protein F [Actinobacteria bacterium]|nr:pH regulation protein F [Actinomycetota bacterium]